MSPRAIRQAAHAVARERSFGAGLVVRETGLAEAPKPRLLDRVRGMRLQPYHVRQAKESR